MKQRNRPLIVTLLAVSCLLSIAWTSHVEEVDDGYRIEIPRELARELPDREVTHLYLVDAELGEASVEGRLLDTDGDGVGDFFRTSQKLRFEPRRTTEIILSAAELDLDGFSCGSAEFNAGCHLTWCAGTRYCLPGPGPGGFVCKCI